MSEGTLPRYPTRTKVHCAHRSADPNYFDQFSKLPPNLLPTAIQVVRFSSNFLDVDTFEFKWQDSVDAINAYKGGSDAQPFPLLITDIYLPTGDDLAYSKYKDFKIYQQTATVDVMVNKIVEFLRITLSVVLSPGDIDALRANIEATFTNLKQASDSGWASFSGSCNGSTSYEYRVLFAFPNPDLPDWFYGLVTTIKLTANIMAPSSWWDLVSSSSHNFAADIGAMELVVQQGFRNPLQQK